MRQPWQFAEVQVPSRPSFCFGAAWLDIHPCIPVYQITQVYIYICTYMFLDQGPNVPPNGIPPHPPKPRGGGSPFVLPFFFPSFLSLFFPSFLLPFPFSFLPSLLPSKLRQQHITTTGGRRCFATLLQSSKPHLFIELFLVLIFSLNPFCFYIHSSKLYICSCNLYRASVIDNHHTTTPHHRGEGGDHDHWGGGGSLRLPGPSNCH